MAHLWLAREGLSDFLIVIVELFTIVFVIIPLHDSLVCTQFGHIILGYIMPKMNLLTSHS